MHTFLFLFLCFAGPVSESFSPDRPGFSTGTQVIAPGTVYLEMGYELQGRIRGEGRISHNLPITNLRFGLVSGLEMNLFWQGLSLNAQDKKVGTDSLGLGLKCALVKADRINLSMLASVTIDEPAGQTSLSPMAGLLWNYSISDRLDAFGVVQFSFNPENGLNSETAVGLALSITERTAVYAEYYNAIMTSPLQVRHFMETGLTYMLNQRLQLDLYLGADLQFSDFRFGFGLAKKL